MLNQFRSFSGSLTTKILLVLLIASFALWGVGDMVMHGGGARAVARVGGQDIGVDSYRRELAVESEQVRRQLGANYSRELLKRLNVPEFVLRRMIQQSLLEQEARRMGFIPDDTAVALEIRKNPAFLGHSDVFDKSRFDAMLRSQGISEKTYVERLRMQLASDKLLDVFAVNLPVDNAMLGHLQAAFGQGRIVTLYRLAPSPGVTPDEAALAAFHREHAGQFTVPELRTVSFVRLAPTGPQKIAPPSEADIKDYYNTHQDQFRLAEQRHVEQLLYGNEEKAREAYAQLQQGKSFADTAKDTQPLNQGALALGAVDRKSLPDNAAGPVFNLSAGGFTEPLQSPFGWHIFRVASIEPAGLQPLDKVRGDIETELARTARENAASDSINRLEDALASGSTLAEAAATIGAKVEQAGTFDQSGKTAQGAENKAIPALDKFIEVAFRTDENTESSVAASSGGIYYVLRVDRVIPEALRPFETIRGEVARAYAQYEASKSVAASASAIEEELRKGRPAADIVAAHPMTTLASGPVHRDSKALAGTMLLPSFTAQLFATDVGGLTPPARDKDGGTILARVTGVAPALAASGRENDIAQRRKELVRAMQEEMMMQYLGSLEARYKVEVHQDVFTMLTEDADNAGR